MKLLSRIIIAALVLAWLQPVAALAIEPWADAALPVNDGLELWLDASRAADDFQWPAGGKLATWRDASGKGRNVVQAQENARPTLIKTGLGAIVRFDGIDDHFRAIEQNTKLETFTLIFVAAPRHNLGAFRALAAFNAAGERIPRFRIIDATGRHIAYANAFPVRNVGHNTTTFIGSDAVVRVVESADGAPAVAMFTIHKN